MAVGLAESAEVGVAESARVRLAADERFEMLRCSASNRSARVADVGGGRALAVFLGELGVAIAGSEESVAHECGVSSGQSPRRSTSRVASSSI